MQKSMTPECWWRQGNSVRCEWLHVMVWRRHQAHLILTASKQNPDWVLKGAYEKKPQLYFHRCGMAAHCMTYDESC